VMTLRQFGFALLLAACIAPLSAAQKNVLLIIADDVGVDMIGAYEEHPLPATTPVIDQLAADGVLFRNAWSLPTCSPTRAAMLTGRLPYQSGIGRAMFPVADEYEVALAEDTIPELLGPQWTTAAIGKWHMHSDILSGITHPLLQGFDTHVGAPWNLPDGTPQSYFDFYKSIDGTLVRSTTYATTDSVNDTIDFIAENQDPWFVWLAFNTPHTPWHDPPQDLHTESVPVHPGVDPPTAVRAMIQAMDTEIGRLLASIDPDVLANTVVIFIGDNGTHPQATTAPFDPAHAKASIFEGGINVPLIISGRGVAKGFQSNGLVQATDIFATVLDIAGVTPPAGTSGVSLTPYFEDPEQTSLRPWVYSERFLVNGFGPYIQHQRAVRDRRHKLIRNVKDGIAPISQRFYDLTSDPFETDNLLTGELSQAQQSSFEQLNGLLATLVPPSLHLGFAKAFPGGVPQLKAGSTLLAGDTLKLSLSSAPKNSTALTIIGYGTAKIPFHGGVLVPDPTEPGLMLSLATDSQGHFDLLSTWPGGLPSGFQLFLQCWIPFTTKSAGWAASNAVQLTTP